MIPNKKLPLERRSFACQRKVVIAAILPASEKQALRSCRCVTYRLSRLEKTWKMDGKGRQAVRPLGAVGYAGCPVYTAMLCTSSSMRGLDFPEGKWERSSW